VRICLINPPWIFKLPYVDRSSNLLGLMYLAGVAAREGHTITIVDALRENQDHAKEIHIGEHKYYRIGLPTEDLVNLVPADTELIGVGAPFTNLLPEAGRIGATLRQAFPRAGLMLGGGLVGAAPELCFCLDQFDWVVEGEGESALLSILESEFARARGDGPRLIQGQPVEDLDGLPLPDRNLAPAGRYFQSGARHRTLLRTAAMITSRGCPYHCHFCSIHSVVGHGWRGRAPKAVMEEVVMLARDHGVQVIELEDDNLLHDPLRAWEIFERWARFRREWGNLLLCSFPNGLRIDKLTPELLKLMQEAGATRLVLPVEHGDLQIRRKMGKPLSDRQIVDACRWASALGYRVDVFVMIGYPDETVEIFESGLKLMSELAGYPGTHVQYLFPQPYPGTRLRQECIQQSYPIDAPDETTFCGIGPAITTPLFDRAELDRRARRFEQVVRRSANRAPHAIVDGRSAPASAAPGRGTRLVISGAAIHDLPGRNHDGSRFETCRFHGKALAGVSLCASSFIDCDFRGAELQGLNAAYSRFDRCRFANVRMDGACLRDCDLQNCVLTGTVLTGSELSGASLSGVDLRSAHLDNAVLFRSRLYGANFHGANLKAAVLSESLAFRTCFNDSIWDDVIARDCHFEECSWHAANAHRVVAHRTRFEKCDFRASVLSGFFAGASFHDCMPDDAGADLLAEQESAFEEIWDGTGRNYVRKHDN